MERLDNSKLSPIQKHIVNMISKEKKLAIVGGPGTGKTILAMSGMSKNSGSKQILLTYSNALSKMINGCDVESSTVHTFCIEFASKIEKKLNLFSKEHNKKYNSSKFLQIMRREYGSYETGWPKWDKIYKAYLKLTPSAKREIKYDVIFIDEGQDLPNEAFEFFNKIADRIIVTYDDAQEIGKEYDNSSLSGKVKELGINCNRISSILGLEESFYDLIDNFRNTSAIEEVSKLFYNNYSSNSFSLRPTSSKRKDGSKPKVIYSNDFEDLIKEIADDAYQMNKQVGLIFQDEGTFNYIKSIMEDAINDDLILEDKFFYKYGHNENMKEADDLNQTGVFLITYKVSKGMEFDDVYLFDCENFDLDTPMNKNKFYVAVTRAKDELTFVFDCEKNEDSDINNIIYEHEELFDFEECN